MIEAKKKTWSEMTSDEREAAVRRLMAAGGSNISVAEELGTTPGSVAGLRYKKGIPSTNDAPSMGKPEKPVPTPPPSPKPPAPPPEPPTLKLSATEATQCEHRDEDDRRCAYEKQPGSPFCGLPHHQKLQTQARRA